MAGINLIKYQDYQYKENIRYMDNIKILSETKDWGY